VSRKEVKERFKIKESTLSQKMRKTGTDGKKSQPSIQGLFVLKNLLRSRLLNGYSMLSDKFIR
jgi:hypothetical protein